MPDDDSDLDFSEEEYVQVDEGKHPLTPGRTDDPADPALAGTVKRRKHSDEFVSGDEEEGTGERIDILGSTASPLTASSAKQLYSFGTPLSGSEKKTPRRKKDDSKTDDTSESLVPILQKEVSESLRAWTIAQKGFRASTWAFQNAQNLPDDNPEKERQVLTATKALATDTAVEASAKELYMRTRELYQSVVAETTASEPRAVSTPASKHGSASGNSSELAGLRMSALQTQLADNVPFMYSGGIKMASGDNPAIWIHRMLDYLNGHPLITQEVIIQAILKTQVSKELKDVDPPSTDVTKDIHLFVNHMLGLQSKSAKWDNYLKLRQLFNGIHQVVGLKRQNGFDYAETVQSFIRRVRRLEEIVYTTSIDKLRARRIYEAVVLGLHPRWRDQLFTLASRSKANFPSEDLTLEELKGFAEQIDVRPDLKGAKTITFELIPETRYRADTGGSRFYLPVFPDRTQDSSPVTSNPGRDSSNKGSGLGKTSSLSSHGPQKPKKKEWVWENEKQTPCDFCFKNTGHRHVYLHCPNRDPVTGHIIRNADGSLRQQPRKEDEKKDQDKPDTKRQRK